MWDRKRNSGVNCLRTFVMMGSRVRVTQAAPVPQDNQDRVPTRFFAFFGSQTPIISWAFRALRMTVVASWLQVARVRDNLRNLGRTAGSPSSVVKNDLPYRESESRSLRHLPAAVISLRPSMLRKSPISARVFTRAQESAVGETPRSVQVRRTSAFRKAGVPNPCTRD